MGCHVSVPSWYDMVGVDSDTACYVSRIRWRDSSPAEGMSRSEYISVEYLVVPPPPRDLPDEHETEPEATHTSASESQKKIIFLLKWSTWRSGIVITNWYTISAWVNIRILQRRTGSMKRRLIRWTFLWLEKCCAPAYSMRTRIRKITEKKSGDEPRNEKDQ